jgi:hypothetical protein
MEELGGKIRVQRLLLVMDPGAMLMHQHMGEYAPKRTLKRL